MAYWPYQQNWLPDVLDFPGAIPPPVGVPPVVLPGPVPAIILEQRLTISPGSLLPGPALTPESFRTLQFQPAAPDVRELAQRFGSRLGDGLGAGQSFGGIPGVALGPGGATSGTVPRGPLGAGPAASGISRGGTPAEFAEPLAQPRGPVPAVRPGPLPSPAVSTPLPRSGPGFWAYEPPYRQYGRPETIRAIIEIARMWHQRHPQGPRLGIGTISRHGGGAIPRHDSHMDGLDVDVLPVRGDGREGNVSHFRPEYSRALTQELVHIILTNPILRVQLIFFNDPGIKGVRWWLNHDNHLHIRFYPSGSPRR